MATPKDDKQKTDVPEADARPDLPPMSTHDMDTPEDEAPTPSQLVTRPLIPSMGLEDEDALDIARPLPFEETEDSNFEPETIFDDAGAQLDIPAARELKIAPESVAYSPEIGDVLNERFEVVELVAVGTIGAVYVVDDLRLKSRKALKLMHPELMKDPRAATRFIEEIKLLQRLSHEHLIRVYDFGQTDRGNLSFFTMEYVEGMTLSRLLKKKGGQLPLDKSLVLIDQILDTLAYVHKHCVYRNLKPLNIIVRPSGKIVMLNVGLSQATGSQGFDRRAALGTIQYIAPELIEDPDSCGPPADLYAVGVLLYQMLTGEVPMAQAPPPSRVNRALPSRLDRVIMRCLSHDPAKRYHSAEETKRAIHAALRPAKAKYLFLAVGASILGGLLYAYLAGGI